MTKLWGKHPNVCELLLQIPIHLSNKVFIFIQHWFSVHHVNCRNLSWNEWRIIYETLENVEEHTLAKVVYADSTVTAVYFISSRA